jgi:DNA-binding MarR family transcriptional regulator
MVKVHKPFLEPLGLTFPQYLVMLELFDASPRSVGDLGAKLVMDTGTITPLLKRLEQSGRITRMRDTADERRVLVELTPAGHALRDAVLVISDQVNAACQMTDEYAEHLRRELDSLGRKSEA